MDDQEEILVRKSKRNPNRIIMFYWVGVIFFGTAMVAVGLGTSILNPKYSFDTIDQHPTFAEPWHPENCSSCHEDIYDSWSQTWHSTFVGTKLIINETTGVITRKPNNPFMPPTTWENISVFAAEGGCCMVTNWENTTQASDVEASGEFWDFGITCAACHSTPGVVNPSATVCSGCHVPGGNQFLGWSQSAHSESLDNLLASDHAQESCLHCMAGQATYMDLTGFDVNDTSLTNIVCVTCHDPHDASVNWDAPSDHMSPNGHQLRTATTNELCGKCHTGEYELISDTIDPATHNTLDCVDCHGYAWIPAHNGTDRFGNPTWVPGAFSSLNHSWVTPSVADDCGRCHGDTNVTRWNTFLDIQADYTELYEMYETQLENVTTKAGEAENKSGVDFTKLTNVYDLIDEAEELAEEDSSLGFHNPEAAERKLKLALAKLDEAYAAAVDAIDTAKRSTPGFEWIGVLLAFSLVGILTALYRKKRR